MRSLRTVQINPQLKLVAFHDKEWNQYKIIAILKGRTLPDNYYSAFEDDKESILGTLNAEVDFFSKHPNYKFKKVY